MRRDTCGACKSWQEGDIATEMGECRRRPPTVYLIPARGAVQQAVGFKPLAVFPPTHATSWCAEFAADDAPEGDA